jgi:uncharacterized membrane protein required for colicin V production
MVSLVVVFYILVILFAVIGIIRGWAQEILVTFSMLLAFFMINIVETVVLKLYAGDTVEDGSILQFWIRAMIIVILVFFGYQTTRVTRFAAVIKKDRISDSFLGLFLGGINGYLIAGSLWFYLAHANYPTNFFINPETLTDIDIIGGPAKAALDFLAILPPAWLGSPPGIYIAVGLAFLFVLVVFI